ncbi:MAG: site-specific DNA-methyltransferase [Desulfobacteraceae bacterium]|nr:site-specific DNA-methyltransferase [Desulfobacteraceae bacterium]
MTHLSENSNRLDTEYISLTEKNNIFKKYIGFNDVCLIILPPGFQNRHFHNSELTDRLVENTVSNLGPEATLVTIGETTDLVHLHTAVSSLMHYQLWITIKSISPKPSQDNSALPNYHFGALVHTKYKGSLKHTKTRIKYTYCPACDKTTKDYGGKKHTYNSYGTLISDVWRDISAEPDGDLSHVIERFADLFGIHNYKKLCVFDCRKIRQNFQKNSLNKISEEYAEYAVQSPLFTTTQQKNNSNSKLITGDVLEKLSRLPDNSIDFVFADPPYNLKKKYNNYTDDLSIAEYFEWCDNWIGELARVLKPGRTCAVLNIPLWAIRHFLYMEKILVFQNWIAWDALSFPVRLIMPAHYAIICFSKGPSRPLPGLTDGTAQFQNFSKNFNPLKPLGEGYCLRNQCVKTRQLQQPDDRGPLTDLWWDIHRLKHNTRRVDHPCQLPSPLMYRLISIYTKPGEIVLDCFNGAGTTTLSAHQLNRKHIGIELSEKYHSIAGDRHEEIRLGIDPFRKVKRKLTEKNSPTERMPEQNYEIPKKTLQLEVRRVAKELGRLPDREEMIKYGNYPIKYYDNYFVSWGEVCAAARHDGMSENRRTNINIKSDNQLKLFE